MAKGKKTVKKVRPGKHPGGRPSAFKQEYCEQVEKFCKLGATDKEIADFFNVAVSTVNKWKKDYPEFSESLKRGKLVADANVADRLYQRAIGYEHEAVKIFNDNGTPMMVKYTERYPPDPTSMIFFLKNRRPQDWRDKVETGFTNGKGEDVDPIVIFQIPDNGRAKDNTTESKDNTATGGLPNEGPQQSG